MVAEAVTLADGGKNDLTSVLAVGVLSFAQDTDGGCIASGETKVGTVFPAGDMDAYTFQGQAGQRAVIAIADISGTLRPTCDFTTRISILAASTPGEVIDHQLQRTGIYTIVVLDFQANT